MRPTLLLLLVVWVALATACDDDTGEQPSEDTTQGTDSGDTRLDTGDTGVSDSEDAGDAETTDDATTTGPLMCDPSLAAASDLQETSVAGWTVRVDAGTGAWSVTPDGATEPVMEGPGTCVEDVEGRLQPAVRVGPERPTVQGDFGAFLIRLRSRDIAPATGAPPAVSLATDLAEITWDVRQDDGTAGTATLRFEPGRNGGLSVALSTSEADWRAGELAYRCHADESFFGLGTQVTGLDLRGRRYPLWTQEQGIGKDDDGALFPLGNYPEAAYAPMGVWHSSRGYSAVVDHTGLTFVDLCDSGAEHVKLTSYPLLPAFELVAGSTPRERLAAVTELTGRIPNAAPWIFGPWNDAVGGPDRLDAVSSKLRAEDIPSSAIWSEDWIGGEETENGFRLSYAWAWDPTTYPDLPATIDSLHAAGFAFLGYFNPFVPETTDMWDEGVAGGWLIEDADGDIYTFLDPGFRTASMVDLTDPEAVAWLQGYLEIAARDLGIDGWMADFAEWLPTDAVLHEGDPWLVHNEYPLLWQAANQETMQSVHANPPDPQEPANNWTFFVRSGFASTEVGTGGLSPLMWGGDQNTDWGYDDGFPTVLPIAAHVGLSGVSVFGSDIAGYTAVVTEPTNKELFLRWTTVGAFSPLMRTHHGSTECQHWAFDRDQETLAHYRRYAIIHTLLYPHWTTLLDDARTLGTPILRHPWLVEPERPGLWRGVERDYSIFVGDDLLVAPVLTEGATMRTVRLPSDGWWPLFGSEPLEPGAAVDGNVIELEVQAPATEIPVFVRPGTSLVLLGDPVDSFYGATDAGTTDLGDVEGEYRVALYPADDGSLDPTVALAIDGAEIARIDQATGWSFDSLSAAPSVDGSTVPACNAPETNLPCYRAASRTVVADADTVTIEAADGATVTLTAPVGTGARWTVGVGAAAWGEWAVPTTITDLDPNVPAPCVEP